MKIGSALHLAKYILDATFSVDRLDHNHPIYFRGGRIVGEMCHHLDLAIHLLGPVQHHEWIVFDSNKETSRQEFYSVYLRHETGNVSRISYTCRSRWRDLKKRKFRYHQALLASKTLIFGASIPLGRPKKQ